MLARRFDRGRDVLVHLSFLKRVPHSWSMERVFEQGPAYSLDQSECLLVSPALELRGVFICSAGRLSSLSNRLHGSTDAHGP